MPETAQAAQDEISQAFGELASTEWWVDLGMVVVGFVGADFVQSAGDRWSPRDLPNEIYGIAVAGASLYAGYSRPALGGSLYTVNEAGKRFGVHAALGINGGN